MVGQTEMRLLNGIFQLAGTFIAEQMTSGKDEHEENFNRYYRKMSKIISSTNEKTDTGERASRLEKSLHEKLAPMMEKLERQTSKPMLEEMEGGDLTEERIVEGKSCLPCSSEHIGQAAGLLKEAVRFAVRDKGIKDDEVEDRVHDALLELNALERKDLTPEKIEKMKPEERELAVYYMNKSAEIRHKLNDIKTPDDLIQASALATNISKDIHKKVWNMSTASGTVEKLCTKAGMTDEERELCQEMVEEALEKE